MNNEEFKNEFVDAVKEALYERGNEVDIKITNVEKMNESYEVMTVTPEGSNIGMNMNLDVFAEAYESGVPFGEIVEQVTHKIEEHLANMPTFDVAQLTDYEQMKEKLSMEVVALDRNAELLAKVPHQEMEDMAVVYRFVVESDGDGRATMLVTNDILDKIGVTPEQLHTDAEKRLGEIVVLRAHIINYAKTRDVYVAYRKSGYSKKFFEEHREKITLHKAAKDAFSNLPDKKIPKVKALNAEYAEVLAKKKSAYAEYRQAKKEMQDYVTAKHNIDAFLRAQENEQERKKQREAR